MVFVFSPMGGSRAFALYAFLSGFMRGRGGRSMAPASFTGNATAVMAARVLQRHKQPQSGGGSLVLLLSVMLQMMNRIAQGPDRHGCAGAPSMRITAVFLGWQAPLAFSQKLDRSAVQDRPEPIQHVA